jgi:cell division protein FtsZ
VATGIDNLDPALETQPAESSFTEFGGKLRNDFHHLADGSSVVQLPYS